VARGGREVEWKERELRRRFFETTTRHPKIDGAGALEPKITHFAFFYDRYRTRRTQVQKHSPPFVSKGNFESRAPPKNFIG
jgi:hypothetical protein